MSRQSSPESHFTLRPEAFQRLFLLTTVVVVSIIFIWMIRSFLITLILAATFSTLFYPVYEKLNIWFRKRSAAASIATLLIVVLAIGIPLSSFLGIVTNEAIQVSKEVKPFISEQMESRHKILAKLEALPGIHYVEPYMDQILAKLGAAVSGIGNFVVARVSDITAGTILFFFHFGIMLYAMFFFFIDGPKIVQRILYLMPLTHDQEMRLIKGFRSVSRATIKGNLLIGLIQGCGAGLALWLAGVPSPLFWTTIMVVLSMIPNIGSPLVWFPASLYLLLTGSVTAGVLVIIWCAVVVGSADNILRPMLVGKDTKMPELLILISTLGGLMLFGLAGFILGPVIAALFLTIWDIYGITFKDTLPETK